MKDVRPDCLISIWTFVVFTDSLRALTCSKCLCALNDVCFSYSDCPSLLQFLKLKLNILISLLPELRRVECDNMLCEATSHVSMVMVICGLKDISAS